jgi:zinc transporter ZupT
VPTNAFLSIGLQTSLAIALHKLPEGFITYATNHANPELGVSVFLALFIHNITEGFAMALPLYLAIGSRLQAIVWSVLLGGVSQPLGAGIAALWLKLAGNGTSGDMGEGVYGGMFAVTGRFSRLPCAQRSHPPRQPAITSNLLTHLSFHSRHHGLRRPPTFLGELGSEPQSKSLHGICLRGHGHPRHHFCSHPVMIYTPWSAPRTLTTLIYISV